MSQEPDPLDPEAERKARRAKLLGRLLIIGFGVLLAVQMIPYAMSMYANR